MTKRKLKMRCTADTIGTVKSRKCNGADFPTVIKVTYTVNDHTYEIRESKKVKSRMIKLGFLPIGQMRSPLLGPTPVGSEVRVKYNPDNPAEAYLPDNIKKKNA